MLRKIIKINEDLCNGCGQCIPNCPEGAIQMINGKARLISDLCCDGLGACLGECPVRAIEVEEREAEPYDERQVMANIIKQGEAVIKAHLEHLLNHREFELYEMAVAFLKEHNLNVPTMTQPAKMPCGCPGTLAQTIKHSSHAKTEGKDVEIPSELSHWPIQLRLVNPNSSWFDGKDLLICADCVPFAFGAFHQKFLQGRNLVVFCPKLDADKQEYIKKLAEIFRTHTITSIQILRMEVPCCGGVVNIVTDALSLVNKQIPINVQTITINGQIKA